MTVRCGLFAVIVADLLCWTAVGHAKADLIIQYEFSQDECQRGVVKDVTGGDRYFGDMVLDNSTASCLSGIGIERTTETPGSPGASSVGNVTLLREELFRDTSSPGRFSLELWLSIDSMPTCENFCTTPILTIGERGVSLDDDCQEDMGMMITYWTESGDFGARFQSTRSDCEKVWSGAAQATENMGNALHLVLTTDRLEFFGDPYAYFEWFINGTRVARGLSQYVPPEIMMTLWDSDFNLQLLDWSRQIPSSFYREGPGIKIFFLAIHNEVLGSTEVLARYSARIGNSTPVVRDQIVGVAEDGELGDHYGTPEYYLRVFPESELQPVPLDIYDSDNDPATPNYDNNTSFRVYVTTLPFLGSLVNSSGEDIVSAPFEVLGDGGVFAVKYRPILNEFSTNVTGNDSVLYANFTFYAIDGESKTRSHTNATVSIYVFSKNDPPEAFNASHDVYAGTRHNIVPLHGTDRDAYDDVHGAVIVEQPARGTLFQVFDNGSASNVTVATGELLWRQSVAYEHDHFWLRSNSPDEQTVGSDIFSFKVFDSDWNFSVPAVINITVVTGISAVSVEGLSQCYEEKDCDVWLHGSAIDDSQGNLSVTITSGTVYGSLFDPITNASIEVGSTLSGYAPYPYEKGVSVTYRPPTDFFTYPDTDWNGTQLPPQGEFARISFYASIYLGNARMSSAEAILEIKIINVNDHSTITCGEDTLQTQATGVVDEDLEFDYPRPDQLYINDFFITEKDKGVDPVRVSVEVENGYLTLNGTLGSRVSFDYRCSGTLEWRCRGDSIRSRSMEFIGAPKDVQNVLNGMLFISYARNAIDNMTITIFDGFEGDCIWEFATSSVRPSCHTSNCSLMINVTDTWLGENGSDGGALISLSIYEFFALFALISALIGILVCHCIKSLSFCLCFCCRRRKHRQISTRQEATALQALQSTSTMLIKSRRIPANIPAGRANKETVAKPDGVPSTRAGKYPLSRLGLLRRCRPIFFGRGSVAATQDIPRDHFEPSDKLVWEDNE